MATPTHKGPRIMVVDRDFQNNEIHVAILERDGNLCLAPASMAKKAAQNCPVCKGRGIYIIGDFNFKICGCIPNVHS